VSDFEINAALVAELRRETGAGMMDCKKALAESGGDKNKALEYLRKKGKAAAEKRAGRSAEQGLVVIHTSSDGKTAALVEVNSETDFVAKNESFRKYANSLADLVLGWKDASGKTVDDLLQMEMSPGSKVGDLLTDLIGAIGEKLAIGNFVRVHVENGYVGSYVHSDSKLGVLVALEGPSGSQPDVPTLGRDLSMQVAAASPLFVNRDEISADKIEYERGVEMERARAEGKPEPAVAKIAEGRVNKWFSEVVLLDQPFVKDPKVFIRDLVSETAKKAGCEIKVKSFVRIRVGEQSKD